MIVYTLYFNNIQYLHMSISKQQTLDWLIELQALAQTGLTYSKDAFDTERYQRIRDITAEIMAAGAELSLATAKELFCEEKGYPTPKIDTRAVICQQNKLLLVQERDGLWSLPGGWCDIDQSIKTNIIKEVQEEAGLQVIPQRILAIHERNRHNVPRYAYNILKFFVQCELLGGQFQPNSETVGYDFFSLEQLPALALHKNNPDQLKLCWKAAHADICQPEFD